MTTQTLPATPAGPSLGQAFLFLLTRGCISFGGPAGEIAILHQGLVERRRWISENRFLHALNHCMLLPGPQGQQLANSIGWLMRRTRGGIVAGALFVLPSLFILIARSWVCMAFGQAGAIAGLYHGIQPAVSAMLVHVAYRVGSRALRNGWLWRIATAAFVALFAFSLPFPLIALAAGVMAYFGGRYSPGKFKTGGGHGGAARKSGRDRRPHAYTGACTRYLEALADGADGVPGPVGSCHGWPHGRFRRAVHRVGPRQAAVHGSAGGHHGHSGRCHREPGGSLQRRHRRLEIRRPAAHGKAHLSPQRMDPGN